MSSKKKIIRRAVLMDSLYKAILKSGPGHGYIGLDKDPSYKKKGIEAIGFTHIKFNEERDLRANVENDPFSEIVFIFNERPDKNIEIAPYIFYAPSDNKPIEIDDIIFCFESLSAEVLFLLNDKGGGNTWVMNKGPIKSYERLDYITIGGNDLYKKTKKSFTFY